MFCMYPTSNFESESVGKCSTGQSFFRTEVSSYRIGTLVGDPLYCILFMKKTHAVMYCMFPHSNFDDWINSSGYVQMTRGALVMK